MAKQPNIELDGTINLLGRGSNCINTAGEKVYPEEVEEAIKLQITELGVVPGHIISDDPCTFCDSENYPSFRRDGNNPGRLFTFATLV